MYRATTGASRLFLIATWCLLIIAVATGLGCRKEPPAPTEANAPVATATAEPSTPSTPSTPEAPTDAPAEPEPDKVVVTVNGHDIVERTIAKRMNLRMRQLAGRLANLPPAYAEQLKKQLRQNVLENLITEQLLSEQVRAANIQVTEADVIAEMEKTAAGQQPPITLEEFKTRVEAQGGQFEDIKEEFRRGMSYRQIVESQWGDRLTVTEEDARTYYDAHPKEFDTPEQVRASHILIGTTVTDPNADPNVVNVAAKQKAEKVLQELKDGAAFADLAKAHSSCPSSARGGDLDFFARGSMVKPFEDAAFGMEPGQVSDIVETKFGYHIIKVTDHKDASSISFDQAKDGIVTKLTDEKKSAIAKEYIQSLRAKATIVYSSPSDAGAGQPVPPASTGPAEG